MYQNVPKDLNFVKREQETIDFWREREIFRKSIDLRKDRKDYVFYDGPPTANGQPHIGHLLTRAVKDLIPRYRTMKGYYVPRKAGWDTHGLPVELEVEKQLGLSGKEAIEAYGIGPFIEKCKESVWKYKGMWEDFSEKVGFWADMDHPYVTYHNECIESEWWALKQIWDRGLLYNGFKIVPYCPRCGTPLSSHEVSQGYKDVKERSAIARFRLKGEDASFLAWTTTPWTLPSNVALCVHPSETYVKAETADGRRYYLAEALCDSVLGEGNYKILATFTGKELEYREYEPLFDFSRASLKSNQRAFYVTCGDYVTLTEGTGIVHIAPAFGNDDSEIGKAYQLPFLQLVNAKGEMTEETPWAGMFCKEADKEILADLEAREKLFAVLDFEHSYPHCWRCDTPLIYYARNSWFIKMTDVKENLIANNRTINWIPESIGEGRFGDWLENLQDWGISRNRYWGTPLNIWTCECGHHQAVGSIQELKERSGNCPEEIELHRPYIDEVTIPCEKCGKEMHRVPEVVDCWFDSGSMPFAQHHYPFENQDRFRREFPANFISEAVDQTRGWFYSLLAISTLLFRQTSFENVIVMGLVQDENGHKMSKSKGNAVDPLGALSKYGADALRWYFYSNSAPWLASRFSGEYVVEGQKKFMSTLWNSYAFYVLYAEIDGFDPNRYPWPKESRSVMDSWLLSRLNRMIREVDENLNDYKILESTRVLENFVDELSNWYVRCCRQRFWGAEMTADKISAYQTLYRALVDTAKVAAPMIPFMTEDLYRNLVCSVDKTAPESVHLTDFPKWAEGLIDEELERQMQLVREIVSLGRAARNNASLKNRQPLSALFVHTEKGGLTSAFLEIIQGELNVKKVEFVRDATAFSSYVFKPQLRLLGKKFGKQLGELRTVLSGLEGQQAKRELDSKGGLTLTLSTGEVTLTPEELIVETAGAEGFASVSEKGITAVLDTKMTPELLAEGLVREVISQIQAMRRDEDFEVLDRIRVSVTGSKRLLTVIEENRETISRDVLAKEILLDREDPRAKELKLNGEPAKIRIQNLGQDA